MKDKQMTNTKYLAGVLAMLLPFSASAQSLEWSAELGLNAAYSNGATETTGSGALEFGYGGAFAGFEIETLYQDPTDDAEITLTLGYSFDMGADRALSLSYSRINLDQSGFSSDEIAVGLEFPLGDNINTVAEVVYDLTGRTTDVSLGAEFGLGNNFTGEVLVGHDGATPYGEAGISYAINDNVSTGILVEMADGSTPVVNFGITLGFGS